MSLLSKAIDFLTDPSGLGFPMLIAAGLGVILYLMKHTSRTWLEADKEIKENKKSEKNRNLPFKPF